MNFFRENKLAALIVAVLIGHLFWIKFHFPGTNVVIDGVERIIIIAFCIYVFQIKKYEFAGWRILLTWQKFYFTALATIFILTSAPIIEILFIIIDPISSWRWHYFPAMEYLPLKIYDLTVGLILVAIAEELVYRKFFQDVLEGFKFSSILIYLISSSTFALLHIYQSAQATFGAFVAGLMLMYVYKKTGTLWVPIVAHYLVNLYLYGIGIPFISTVPT